MAIRTTSTGQDAADPRLGEALDLLARLPNVVIDNLNRVGVDPIAPQPRSAWRDMLVDGRVDPGWFIRAATLISEVYDAEASAMRPQLRLVQGGGEGA